MKFLVVQPLDKHRHDAGRPVVAADAVAMAGVGELVYYVASREAAEALEERFVPVDHAIVGLVDHVTLAADERTLEVRADADAVYKSDREEFGRGPVAEDGGVYVVRSVHWGKHDTLAAFQVIGTDRHGVTIAWRQIRSYEPVEHPRRRDR